MQTQMQPQQSRAPTSTFFDMMGSTSSAPITPVTSPPVQGGQLRTSQNVPAGPNYSGVSMIPNNQIPGGATGSRPAMGKQASSFGGVASSTPAMSAQKPKSNSAFDFDDLFALSGAKSGASSNAPRATGSSMANLAAQKQNTQIWGGGSSGGGNSNSGGNDNGDLLF